MGRKPTTPSSLSPLPIVASLFVPPAGVSLLQPVVRPTLSAALSSPALHDSSDLERAWTPTMNALEDEDDEQRLWCVCQTAYQDGVLMICCDECNAWFHSACVGVDESLANFLQAFFCPTCAGPERQTRLLQACARQACGQPAGGGKRYCSVQCGLFHAQSLLREKNLNKGQVNGLKQVLKSVRLKDGVVTSGRLVLGGELVTGVMASGLNGREIGQGNGEEDGGEIAEINGSINGQGPKQEKWHVNGSEKQSKQVSESPPSYDLLLSRLQNEISRHENRIQKLEQDGKICALRLQHLEANLKYAQEASEDLCHFNTAQVKQEHEWRHILEEIGQNQNPADQTIPTTFCTEPKKCKRHNEWRKSRLNALQGLQTRIDEEIDAEKDNMSKIQTEIDLLSMRPSQAIETPSTISKVPEQNTSERQLRLLL